MTDSTPRAPEPGDFILSPAPPLGSRVNLSVVEGPFVGTFDSTEEAFQEARVRMDRENFWPDLWWLDDHGGLTPYVGEGR